MFWLGNDKDSIVQIDDKGDDKDEDTVDADVLAQVSFEQVYLLSCLLTLHILNIFMRIIC